MEEEEGTAGRRERGRRGWKQKKVKGGGKNGRRIVEEKKLTVCREKQVGRRGKVADGDGEVDNDENGKERKRSKIRSMQRGILTYP